MPVYLFAQLRVYAATLIREICAIRVIRKEAGLETPPTRRGTESFDLRARAKALLEHATRAVEIAIETDEGAAMDYLETAVDMPLKCEVTIQPQMVIILFIVILFEFFGEMLYSTIELTPFNPKGVLMMTTEQVINQNPEICHGTPVFAGTRVPVKTLIDYLAAGDSLDYFLEGFPTVSREQAVAFLELALVQTIGTEHL